MLENNTLRMIMLIGAAIIVGLLIVLLINNFGEIKDLFNKFLAYRLQKY